MVARNPTGWTEWIAEETMYPHRQIIETGPDDIIDDQVYVLDAEMLVTSTNFFRLTHSTAVLTTLRTFYLKSKDMCGDATVTNNEIPHAVCVYAWVDDAATKYTVRLASTAVASSTADLSVDGAAHLTPTWIGWQTLNIKTNNNEDTLLLQATLTAGTGNLFIAGIGIFAEET